MKKYLFVTLFLKFFIFVWPGIALADSSINGRWLDYFDEGDSIRVDRGVLVTTRKPNERAGGYLKTGYWTWDLRNTAISFRVKVSKWEDARVVSLIVGNGLKFTNAATFDIRRRFVGAPDNEWVEIVVPPSAWTVEGEVDWKNIDSVLFSVMDAGENRITAQIANIRAVPMTKSPGVVSITVDDGLTDTMQMADVMKAFGYAGTAFIDVTQIGQPGFITEKDVAALAKANWDISGHNMGRLTKMSIAQLETHVAVTSGYLQALGTPGAGLYALPNGERNAAVIETVQTKFPYIFNIDGMSNDLKYHTPINVNRHSIDKHTSLALAKKWVDDAKANGEWVIINFHSFTDTWEKEEDWSIADFTLLLEYINEQKVLVVPVSTVVN